MMVVVATATGSGCRWYWATRPGQGGVGNWTTISSQADRLSDADAVALALLNIDDPLLYGWEITVEDAPL